MLYFLGWFFSGLWIRIFHGYRVQGAENFPKNGGVVLVSNHVSNWDPFALGNVTRRKVYFMAKKELFRFKPLAILLRAWGAFPVDRGGADREALEKALHLLSEGKIVGIFVEGGRNRTGGTGMMTPQPGAAMLALKAGVPIVPVALVGTSGKNEGRFRSMRAVVGSPVHAPENEEQPRRNKTLYQEIGMEIVREISRLKGIEGKKE